MLQAQPLLCREPVAERVRNHSVWVQQMPADGAVRVSFVYYYYVSKKHFGGITNAVASFFIQICELIIPCMVLIAWKFI